MIAFFECLTSFIFANETMQEKPFNFLFTGKTHTKPLKFQVNNPNTGSVITYQFLSYVLQRFWSSCRETVFSSPCVRVSRGLFYLKRAIMLSVLSQWLVSVMGTCIWGLPVHSPPPLPTPSPFRNLVWMLCEAFGWLPGNSCSSSNQAAGHSVGVTVPPELQMHRNPRCFDSVCSDQMYHVCATAVICTWVVNPFA